MWWLLPTLRRLPGLHLWDGVLQHQCGPRGAGTQSISMFCPGECWEDLAEIRGHQELWRLRRGRATEALLAGKRITFTESKQRSLEFPLNYFWLLALLFYRDWVIWSPWIYWGCQLLPPTSTSVPRPVFHHLVYKVVCIYFLLFYDWNFPEHLWFMAWKHGSRGWTWALRLSLFPHHTGIRLLCICHARVGEGFSNGRKEQASSPKSPWVLS